MTDPSALKQTHTNTIQHLHTHIQHHQDVRNHHEAHEHVSHQVSSSDGTFLHPCSCFLASNSASHLMIDAEAALHILMGHGLVARHSLKTATSTVHSQRIVPPLWR